MSVGKHEEVTMVFLMLATVVFLTAVAWWGSEINSESVDRLGLGRPDRARPLRNSRAA
jgi:hypothetical protein